MSNIDPEILLFDKRRTREILGNIGDSTFYRLAKAGKLDLVKVGAKTCATAPSVRRCAAELPKATINRRDGKVAA